MDNLNITFVEEWRQLKPLQLTPKVIYDRLKEDDNAFDGSEEICIVLEGSINTTLVDLLYDEHVIDNSTGKGHAEPLVRGEKRQDRFLSVVSCLRIIALLHNKGRRGVSIYERIRQTRAFIIYMGEVPQSLDSARTFLNQYIEKMRDKIRAYTRKNVKTGQPLVGMSQKSALLKQNDAIAFIKEYFFVERKSVITRGIDLISVKGTTKLINHIQPLSDQEQAREFSYYTLMFRRLTDIILEHETLPQKIDFVEGHIWVAASGHTQISLVEPNLASNIRGVFKQFNFTDGTYYTPWAVEQARGKPYTVNQRCDHKRSAKKSYDIANMERSSGRIRLAVLAVKAYFMHCLFVTGMNDSVLSTLLYSPEYEITKSKQSFRNIKWRAKGREVSFDIQYEFIEDFGKFLKIREYLLSFSKQDFPLLFFGFQVKNQTLVPFPTTGQASSEIRECFKSKCPFKLNPSREIRVTKGLWVRKTHGPIVSAWILQHTIGISFTAYSGNDDETTKDEFTDFFVAMNKNATLIDKDAKDIPSGKCAEPPEPNNPKATGDFYDGTPEELKSCGKAQGCVFCKKFRAIGDEIGSRKLLSLKYVTEQFRPLAKNNEHFKRVYQSTIDRIDSLFEELIKLKPESQKMIREVEISVFKDEKLSDFWSKKLAFLIDLGVL